MKLTTPALPAAAVVAALLLLPPAAAADMPLPKKVPVPGSEAYVLQLPDGTVTANDTCPVAKRPLNPRMPVVYVNGRPIGFC